MNLTSTLGKKAFGYLQTICPNNPAALLDIENHLALITANWQDLSCRPTVHYITPADKHENHGISLVVMPSGDYCYNIPMFVYLNRDQVFPEIALVHGRFYPLAFDDFINNLVGGIMEVYNKEQANHV